MWGKLHLYHSNVYGRCCMGLILCRFIHTNVMPLQTKLNSRQITKLTQKFILKNDKFLKRSKPLAINQSLVASKLQKEDKVSPKLKRLNNIFMEKITEIISTSSLASFIAEKGVEITETRFLNDLSAIHVLWYCSYPDHLEEVSKVLASHAGNIRYELRIQQLLGKIPLIVFVRDDMFKNGVEVDRLLKVADYGPDYEPIHFDVYRSQPLPSLQKEISPEIWKKLDESMSNITPKETVIHKFPNDVLHMKHDVLGVHRDRIMTMVKKGCKDALALHRKSSEEPIAIMDEPMRGTFLTHCSFSRTTEIKKWISQYKKTRRQIRKREQNMENKMLSINSLDDDENKSYEEEEEFSNDYENWEEDFIEENWDKNLEEDYSDIEKH